MTKETKSKSKQTNASVANLESNLTNLEKVKDLIIDKPLNTQVEKEVHPTVDLVADKPSKADDVELSSELVEQTFDSVDKSMNIFKQLLDKKLKKEISFADSEVINQKINVIFTWVETLTKLGLNLNKLSSKMKNKRTNKKTDSSEPRKLSGFTKPVDVPEKFKTFFVNNILKASEPELKEKFGEGSGFNINELHPRTTITKIIFTYIRSKELYVENNENQLKKLIKLDTPLKDLFDFKEDTISGFKDFQKYLGILYPKQVVEKE